LSADGKIYADCLYQDLPVAGHLLSLPAFGTASPWSLLARVNAKQTDNPLIQEQLVSEFVLLYSFVDRFRLIHSVSSYSFQSGNPFIKNFAFMTHGIYSNLLCGFDTGNRLFIPHTQFLKSFGWAQYPMSC
jgi:hypothetical protein